MVVTLRMQNHASASGYDRLQDYIDAYRIQPPDRLSIPQRALAKALSPMTAHSGSRWYHRNNLISELHAASKWVQGDGQVFHFLYGENSFRYLGILKQLGRKNSIVCTYHTPPEKFSQVVKNRKHLARVDAAIVVSTMQMEFLSEIIGPERVFFVRHGINVDYFKPLEKMPVEREELQCLFVGTHLRDFETLSQTAKFVSSNKRLRFTVVTRSDNASYFSRLDNVQFLSGVDDDELLQLYQYSDLLVFPLLDCTANNSLLEAMACGLPILTTDLQGVRDYVSEESAILTPKGDSRELADALLALECDRDRLRKMGRASRANAMELRWETIAARTNQIYMSVCQ